MSERDGGEPGDRPATGRGVRTAGREAAVQILYQMDARDGFDDPDRAADGIFGVMFPDVPLEVQSFARELCRGVAARLAELDALLARCSTRWRVERMARADRSVLRLAAHELTAPGGPPAPVVINEAVELARAFGTPESPAFVNGVLARLAREIGEGGEPR